MKIHKEDRGIRNLGLGITFPLTRLEALFRLCFREISFPQETWEEEDKVASAAAEEEPASAQLSGVNMFQHVSTHQIKKRKIYPNITDPVSCGCMWCYDLY